MFLKRLQVYPPHDPALTFLTIYLKDTVSYYRDIYPFMFFAALLTTLQKCKNFSISSADEWIVKM